jgi:recombinational DNA repair protein (RecF pathway)
MPLYRDAAIVLRTHKLGEADRIVTALTRSRGKVRAVANGVRRTPLATARTSPCERVSRVMMRSASPSLWVRSTTASSR